MLGPVIEDVVESAEPERIGTLLGTLGCPATTIFDHTRRKLATDLLVLPDATFGTLASTGTGTDVVARVQLTEEKTVAQGPFYVEQLPPETVLTALLTGEADHLERLKGLLDGKVLQLGGDETVGKGLLWCRLHDAESIRRALPSPASAGETSPPAPDEPAASSPGDRPAAMLPRRR